MKALLVGLVIWLAPTAAGAPVSGELLSRGDVHFYGTMVGASDLAGAELQGPISESLMVHVQSAHVLLRNAPQIVLRVSDAAPGSDGKIRRDLEPETIEEFDFTGPIWWTGVNTTNSTFTLLPAAAGKTMRVDFNVTGRQVIKATNPGAIPVTGETFRPIIGGRVLEPAGQPGAWAVNGTIEGMVDQATIFAYEGQLRLGNRTITTGEIRKEVDDPMGWARASRVDRIHAVIETRGLTALRLGPEWVAYCSSMRAEARGDLAIEQVYVSGKINHTVLDANKGLFQAIGEFDVATTWTTDGARWKLEGDASFVAVDAIAVYGLRQSAVAAAAVAVVAIAGIALGLLFGLNKAFPLKSRTRQTILSTVQMAPGIPQEELRRRLGCGRATVRFHVRVLTHAHFIESRPVRGRVHLYPNGGSTHHFVDADSRVKAADAMALTAQPIRRAVVDSLMHGPLTQTDLLRRVPGSTYGSLSYHLAVLGKAKLIKRQPRTRGGPTYCLSIDPTKLAPRSPK